MQMLIRSQKSRTNLRILHTPVNIGNQPFAIAAYERQRGHQSTVVVQIVTWVKYPYDILFALNSNYDFVGITKRLLYGLASPFRFDVINYYFGKTLLTWDDSPYFKPFKHWDIKIAHFLGKKVIATYQGCDIRIAEQSNKINQITMCNPSGCRFYQNCLNYTDQYRLKMFKSLNRYFDHTFYLNPELGHFIPHGQFLPYASVDIDDIKVSNILNNSKPVVLHAPSDGSIKGTAYITKALETLRNEFEFELKIIQNLSREEAMKEYANADLVIDQVLAGWYGAFAVEVMAMGKPVACYIRESDLQFVPKQMVEDLPILKISPQTIVDDLRKIFSAQNQWRDYGAKSRLFVEKWHNPKVISEFLEQVYRGKSQFLSHDLLQQKNTEKKL